ncbi:MAG: UDP-N-acetylglucosamine 2-epimerase (non-hydrolyzing) [Verrucomicrobiae bacterium]|nr:UDP-N-acetylglucosamine 2-epimerase (non-hydrolyzing) [Verrucomicrobiae bacterium]
MKSSSPFLVVAGARPNFMKVAPILREMRRRNIPCRLLNTGQHHDPALSDIFLKELGLGKPAYNLEVGSGSHAIVTARVMERCEPIIQKLRPRAVVVVGDVNSTLAAALTAAKLRVPVAHVEAGLRSRDRAMPEEINRIATDHVSDLLLTPSSDANANLRQEGIPNSKIKLVGNVMIDSLQLALRRKNRGLSAPKGDYFLMTFHRPSNVDSRDGLKRLAAFLDSAARLLPVHLPLHPRTQNRISGFKLGKLFTTTPRLHLHPPLGYFDFIHWLRNARGVVTDSGGIQEETAHLNVPCLIMRTTTERPICVTRGSSELIGEDYDKALSRLRRIRLGRWKQAKSIPLWDGHTAHRIVDALVRLKTEY